MPAQRLLLTYDYVDGIVDKRGPYREEHLANITAQVEAGRLLTAGAVGDPPTGALFVWAADAADEIEAFVAADPYVRNGLVTAHRVEPWAVVTE